MKKIVALTVLCIASMAMGAVADLDLVATMGADDTIILTNVGDNDISVGNLFFMTDDDWTVELTDARFIATIGLPDINGGMSFISFGPAAVFSPGESSEIGVVTGNVPDGLRWEQGFVDAAPEAIYAFYPFPEPASMSMLALGALALVRRRR